MARTIIVVPCFNEVTRFSATSFRSFASRWPEGAFLLVNDGSTDKTSGVLRALQDSMPESFTTLDLPQNVGKAEAVRQGFELAFKSRPDYVGFWDADLAT